MFIVTGNMWCWLTTAPPMLGLHRGALMKQHGRDAGHTARKRPLPMGRAVVQVSCWLSVYLFPWVVCMAPSLAHQFYRTCLVWEWRNTFISWNLWGLRLFQWHIWQFAWGSNGPNPYQRGYGVSKPWSQNQAASRSWEYLGVSNTCLNHQSSPRVESFTLLVWLHFSFFNYVQPKIETLAANPNYSECLKNY